jgi:hypothetical protein
MSDWYTRRFSGGQQSAYHPPAPPPPAQPHTQRPVPSALLTDKCPSCMSGNYMGAPGSNYKRCYDCGHPVVQTGTGVGGVSNASSKAVHRATQVEGSGFNPSVIIGRVE